MIKTYFKSTLRNIKRNRLYSFINFICLSVGITVLFLSASYLNFETSFDNFHQNKENKYRLLLEDISDNSLNAQHSGYFYPYFKTIPEIKEILRVMIENDRTIKCNEKLFKENVIFADSNFFSFFNFRLKEGSYESFMHQKNAFITEKLAEKYFGDEDPIGKIFWYKNNLKLEVAGVLENAPENSHLQFDIIAPASAINRTEPNRMNTLQNSLCLIYVELYDDKKPETVAAKFIKPYEEAFGAEEVANAKHILQPLSKIYLNSYDIVWDDIKKGNVNHVYSIAIAALLVLLISCFNYINISLALLSKRAREVGIKKVVGAKYKQLIIQFIIETFVVTFISVWLAVLITEVFKPIINNYFHTQIPLGYNLSFGLLILFFLVLLPILIGLYPAILYASFRPIDLFKKGIILSIKAKKRRLFRFGFREFLLAMQFVISAILIIATISVLLQIDFLKNSNLGYEKENRIVVQNPWNSTMTSRYEVLKQKCMENPDIESFCGCYNYPSAGLNFSSTLESIDSLEEKSLDVNVTSVDVDFFKSMGANIVEGRNFSKEHATDEDNSIILNEAAVELLNLKESVLGKKFKGILDDKTFTVIGIVENIHFFSRKEKIAPAVFLSTGYSFPYYSVYPIIKVRPGKYNETLDFLKTEMEALAPEWPFIYFDLESSTNMLYEKEQRMFLFFVVLAFLAVLLSNLGIIGLVLLNLEKRNKEIAIRRVNGASLSNIIKLINKDFTVIIIIGLFVAFPLAYLIIESWLTNFAYRISTPWLFYILAGIVIYSISFFCVLFQSKKIAKINPVEALKYE